MSSPRNVSLFYCVSSVMFLRQRKYLRGCYYRLNMSPAVLLYAEECIAAAVFFVDSRAAWCAGRAAVGSRWIDAAYSCPLCRFSPQCVDSSVKCGQGCCKGGGHFLAQFPLCLPLSWIPLLLFQWRLGKALLFYLDTVTNLGKMLILEIICSKQKQMLLLFFLQHTGCVSLTPAARCRPRPYSSPLI